MCAIKIVYLVLLYCIYISSSVKGACVLKLTDEQIYQPKITRYLGPMNIAMQYSNKKIFFKNERFSALCSTGFTHESFIYTKYTFECKSNGIISTWPWEGPRKCYRNGECEGSIELDSLSCESPVLAIYDSSNNFDWCDIVYGSYNLVINNTIEKIKIAEICFNYETTSPHIVKYFSVPNALMDHNNLSKITELWDNNVTDIEIPYENVLNSAIKFNFEIVLDYLPQKENFEYDNLIQHGILHKLEAQKPTTSILWWHNLRVSNWRRYSDALSAQSEKSIYKIYAGTAGILKLQGESKSKYFQNIPAYVWNVIQEINGTEKLVIMGYNSPYFELFDEKDTIVCEDICDTISWLKEIHHYFRIAHFGRIFCCSVDDLLGTNMLTGLTLSQNFTWWSTTTPTAETLH